MTTAAYTRGSSLFQISVHEWVEGLLLRTAEWSDKVAAEILAFAELLKIFPAATNNKYQPNWWDMVNRRQQVLAVSNQKNKPKRSEQLKRVCFRTLLI